MIRLHIHRLGDGTTRISGLLPDTAADRLATYLEAFIALLEAYDPTGSPSAAATPPPS